MNCNYCNSQMVEFLIDKFICINEKCDHMNLIQDIDGDPID